MPTGSYFIYDKEWKMQLDSNLNFVEDFVPPTTFTTPTTGFDGGYRYEPVYLDRQDQLDCKGKGMNGFALNSNNGNDTILNFNVSCGGIESKYLDSTLVDKATPGNIQNDVTALKYHNVDCGSSGVITQYILGRPNLENINYNYKCAPVVKSKLECKERSTGWAGFGDYVHDLSFLNPPVKCKDNESLSRFQLKQGGNEPGTWDDWYKYDYTCCSTSVQNSITVVSDSTPPELPFHLENEDNLPLVFFVVEESNKSNPEVIRLFQILLKDQPWGYCADGYHHTDEGDCVLESPQLHAGFGCPEGSTDPDFLPEKQCVLPDFVDYPLGVKSYGADCAAPNTEFNYLTHYPNPPGAIAIYNFCKTGTRTAQCAIPGYTVSQQGGFDHCMRGPLLTTPLPIGLVAIASGTKVRDESFGGVWPMQAITSATLAFDGRLIVFSPTTGYKTIVPYKPEGGSLNLFASTAIKNTGVWRFQTVQGTNKGLSLWNKEVFPKYPMTPQDYMTQFKDPLQLHAFNCAPGDAGGPLGDCGTCPRTQYIDVHGAPLVNDLEQCKGREIYGIQSTVPYPIGDGHIGYHRNYSKWCDQTLVATEEQEERKQKCASLDPSVLDIKGQLDFCKCTFDTIPITINGKQFDSTNPNTRNLVYAPWSEDTKTSPIYQTFCAQHDTANNAPLVTSDVRCQAWCDANPYECAPVKDDYCTKFPKAALCASECNKPTLDCYNTFDQMCTGANLDTDQCQTWCANKGVDCDGRLKSYCATLSPEALAASNICGCFRSDQFYTTFFDSLKKQVTIPNSEALAQLPSCYFPLCSNQNLKPFKDKQEGVTCPNVTGCITNVDFTNTGEINGEVTVTENNDCHFCKPGAVWDDNAKKCVSYNWQEPVWTVCPDDATKECAVIQCLNQDNQVEPDDSKCPPPKPATRRPHVTYDWAGAWSACSKLDEQTIVWNCMGSDGKKYADHMCTAPEPATSKPCVYDGEYEWKLGGWSACTPDEYGRDNRTRSVQCWETSPISELALNDGKCAEPVPARSEKCEYEWWHGDWHQSCDNRVNSEFKGKRRRDIKCRLGNDQVDDTKCVGEDKPAEYDNCIYGWYPSNPYYRKALDFEDTTIGVDHPIPTLEKDAISACNLSTDHLTIPASQYCVDQYDNEKAVDLSFCVEPKITASQKCEWNWKATKSACDQSNGKTINEYHCFDHNNKPLIYDYDNRVFDDSMCTKPKPESEKCSTHWVTSDWKCEGANKMVRTVNCFDNNNVAVPKDNDGNYVWGCTDTLVPVSQHATNSCADPIPMTYAWSEGGWTPPPPACDPKTNSRTRTNLCKDVDGYVSGNAHCPSPAPAAFEACEEPLAYSWTTGDWQECAQNSTQIRDVWCSSNKTGKVSDSFCNIIEKPDTTQSCTPVLTYEWKVTKEFGECSAEGVKVREVKCVAGSGKIIAPSEEATKCTATKPAISEKCVPPSTYTNIYIALGVVALLIIVIIIFLIYK
jgi:hypothetical protein